MPGGGDDLADDFYAVEAPQDTDAPLGDILVADDESDHEESESESIEPKSALNKKRPRSSSESSDGNGGDSKGDSGNNDGDSYGNDIKGKKGKKKLSESEEERERERRRKVKKEKSGVKFESMKTKRKRLNDEYVELVSSIPTQDLEIQQKFLLTLIREQFGATSTDLEMGEMVANVSNIHVEKGEKLHSENNIHLLIKRLKGWNKMFSADDKDTGKPSVLFICPSKERCAQILKEVSTVMQPGVKVGKLFGKRDKSAQGNFLSKVQVPVCVGTIARVKSLVDDDVLDLSSLEMVFVDMARNPKNMTILDINDTRPGVVTFLAKTKPKDCKILLL